MSWITRLTHVLSSRRLEEDLDAEIQDHLERRAEDLQHSGLSAAEAKRQAARVFGNVTSLREQSRDVRLWATLESACQDARYAWRGLRRNPVFAITAVVSLGLATGANTAIYSIIDAALLRPLPVEEPDRLVTLATSADDETFSYPLYEELRAAAADSGRLALFDVPNRVEAQATVDGAAYEDVIQQFVSPDAFDVLGIAPSVGQLFSVTEDRFPSPRAVVVLSYDYWRRRFGADPAVVGRRFVISGRTYSILGVARQGFSGVEPSRFVDVWLPITLTDPGIFTNAEFKPFHLIGRLAAGVTREQLTVHLQPAFHLHQEARIDVSNALPPAMETQLRQLHVLARPGANGISAFRQTFARSLWMLLVVSSGILLIACANVASLLLARSTARAGELALRVSLGARRARLVRQLLTESLLISLLAGLSGWALARLLAPALVTMVSKPVEPVRFDLSLDARVFVFCLATCVGSALFFGLLPAWQATRARPMTTLRQTGGTVAGLRWGRLFVSVQVAFAFCLVTGGFGFLFSLRNLATVEAGFDPKGVTVLTVTNNLGPPQWARQLALAQQMQMRTAALPKVQGAATAWMAMFSGARRAQRVVVPGRPASAEQETFYRVSPGYLATLRTPLLSGRDLTFRDNDDEPVPTVINRAFARKYFGGDSVIGKDFWRDDGVRHRVVGLAADSHFGDLHSGPESIAYMPMKPPRAFTLYVRSTLDAGSVAGMVAREAAALGSDMRVRDVTTLDALVGTTMLKEKLLASLGGAGAALGLMLAAIGLFGLLNYSVSRRTREIGIRAALGAARWPLYGLVLKELMEMIAVGLVLGLAGSVALMRVAQSLLFGVHTADVKVFGASTAMFLGAALIASGLPARRAAAIDPVIALRQE